MSGVFHRPREWRIDEAKRALVVSWDDGAESTHPWEELRRQCPCAYCAGEGGMTGAVNEATRFTELQVTLKVIYPVGRYGITPEWGDGHDTGIQTFARLRTAAGLA